MVRIKVQGLAKLVGTGLLAVAIVVGTAGSAAGAKTNQFDPGDFGGLTAAHKFVHTSGATVRLPYSRFGIGFLPE